MPAVAERNPGHAEHFALAQQALGFVTWIWNGTGDRARWLGDLSPLLGLPEGSFSGDYEDYLRSVHAEDVPASRRTLKECITGVRPEYRTEERVVWPDGTLRWLETYGRATFGADGRIVNLSGVVRDVTERKRREEARLHSELKFRALIETSPEPMSITRLRDSCVLEVNEACARLIGLPREKILGRTTTDFATYTDAADRGRIVKLLAAEGKVSNFATRLVRLDGTLINLLESCKTVKLEGETCVVWSWRDVTEIHSVQRALAESERRYRSLFDAALDYIMVFSPDGALVDINPSACKALGYSREEVLGAHFSRIVDPAAFDRMLPRVAEVTERRKIRGERTIKCKDGSEVCVEFAASALPDGNVLAVVRDVSERKRAQSALADLNASLERRVRERTAELEAANRELDSFSHSVSHDLRAPLFQIGGFANLLRKDRDSALSADARRFLERIEHGADQMGQLLERLLEFSSAGRGALRRVPVDMQALVGEVLLMLRGPESARAEIRVADVPPVRGDAMLLRQVWQNLLGNALKFSRYADAPQIEVGAERRDGAVEYFVCDNGAGFDMRKADKLFGVFERLDTAQQFEGTGAGLSIVKRIVERHGGRITASGEPGRGACLRFTLPE